MDIHNVLQSLPIEICNALETEFADLESRFARQDWGPAELNGGRFAEAVLRYLEWKQSNGTFTPIGQQLNRSQIINRATNDTSIPDSLRFHIPKSAELLLDFRNRRHVAHLGQEIDVNEMDARLVLQLCSWTLAEIIRVESNLSPNEIQQLINRLSTKTLPLVEEIGGDIVVLATHLNAPDRSLIVLYKEHPNPVEITSLRNAVKYQHSTRFQQLIKQLDANGIVHSKKDQIYLTAKGVAWVEKNINMRLQID